MVGDWNYSIDSYRHSMMVGDDHHIVHIQDLCSRRDVYEKRGRFSVRDLLS